MDTDWMQWLRGNPTLYYVALVFTGLGAWLRDVNCFYIAGACVVVGFLQQLRDDKS